MIKKIVEKVKYCLQDNSDEAKAQYAAELQKAVDDYWATQAQIKDMKNWPIEKQVEFAMNLSRKAKRGK